MFQKLKEKFLSKDGSEIFQTIIIIAIIGAVSISTIVAFKRQLNKSVDDKVMDNLDDGTHTTADSIASKLKNSDIYKNKNNIEYND